MKDLFGIYLAFFRMGIVTFGGGYAMLPILQREAVEKKRWVTQEEVMDFYALSQGLPGIIAVNVSVFIGYHCKRVSGAVAAALGVVSPCVIVITIIAAFLTNFQDNPYVRHAFAGVAVGVSALILDAVVGLWKKGVKDVLGLVLCILVFLGTAFTEISPILMIFAAALIGIAAGKIRLRGGQKGGKT